MTPEEADLSDRLLRFTVSAEVLIEAYRDVVERGEPSDPGLAAAALADVGGLVNSLCRAGVDSLSFSGADVNRLTERGRVRRVPADWTARHDWQVDTGGVKRCTACSLAHVKWTGRGCPGAPEVLGNSDCR